MKNQLYGQRKKDNALCKSVNCTIEEKKPKKKTKKPKKKTISFKNPF